jgi:hypothetical protein
MAQQDSSANRRTAGTVRLPSASPLPGGPDQAAPVDSALRLVIMLMFVNLGLSVLTTIITLLLGQGVPNYELAHTHLPTGTTPAELATMRHTLQLSLWLKLAATVSVSAIYIWRAYALRNGSRGAYLRLYYICVFGILGMVWLILGGQYPIWMRVEQGMQAVVLVALLWAVSRRPVRARFAKRHFG